MKTRQTTVQQKQPSFLSNVEFDSLPIHPDTKLALSKELGYKYLSAPQSLFLPAILAAPDQDFFVKATTGSGKTLGFLIPAIQALLQSPPVVKGSAVGALILSPSRELAIQTCNEAIRLMTHHGKIFNASVVIGGTDRSRNIRSLSSAPPSLLVATPGRLEDLLTDVNVRTRVLGSARIVVLDEADRLLDMGFVPAIRRILAGQPSLKDRRTLMFSATVEKEVLDISQRFMRPGYGFIDTVALARAGMSATKRKRLESQETDQSHITQSAYVSHPENVHLALLQVLSRRRTDDPKGHKLLVFFPSNAMVEFYAELFRTRYDIPVLMLTGGLPQRQREQASNQFRGGSGVTLFASDVAGRGMDFPGVTCVVQVGVVKPDVYKQRVGRTGRGGASGDAVIILGSDEHRVLETIQRIFPVVMEPMSTRTRQDARLAAQPPLNATLTRLAGAAYRGTMGAYNSEMKTLGWTKQEMVDAIAARFRGVGLKTLPIISDKTLGKMGLAGVKLPTK